MRGQVSRVRRLARYGELALRRLRRRDPKVLRVLEIVARAFDLRVEMLFERSRRWPVVRARQVSIYLIHVCLHRQILEAARIVGLDRTTGSYACSRVEELREESVFDAEVGRLEIMIVDGLGTEARRAG